jgi:DNA repair protein RecN (Recombination protein N)
MLTGLSIRNVVLIEALDLAFGRGLGVLTGETGAGKSILLDSLGLVLGDRADAGLIRAGTDEGQRATATFEFAQLPEPLRAALAEAEIAVEPGEPLIIRRRLRVEGGSSVGSRAFVNDQPVSVALLRELARSLVELHGQHDDGGLVNARGHRALLDRYARAELADVAAAWDKWRAAETALAEAQARLKQPLPSRICWSPILPNVQLAPRKGKEAELAGQRAAMQKGERLSGDLAELQHLWTGSESALASLRSAARRLDRIAHEHPLLTEALEALDRAVIEASEAEDKLEKAADALAHDPLLLDRIETRLFDLRAACCKHAARLTNCPRS